MTTNALAVYEQMGSLKLAAEALHASGYFSDVKGVAQAMVKVMAGAEIGLPPFASMTGIHIVQGKPVIGANLIATLVKNDARYDYRIVKGDATACVLDWYENGARVGQSEFTMAEAQAAGLTNKPVWKQYPSDMLFARALTRGARRFAPGIFGGSPIYTPEEIGTDVGHDDAIIDGVFTAQPQSQPTPAQSTQNGNGNGHMAPVPKDEAMIHDVEAREFIPAVAVLLQTDEETVKAWFRANGVTSVPKTSADRVRAYKNIRDALKDAPADGFFDEGQPELVVVPAEAVNGAYND
ncbi:MAG: hypothetical protein H3C69_09245 [Candidatus Promineofilum sp.]|nr:hypothetical protein [Promineifilum sp.]